MEQVFAAANSIDRKISLTLHCVAALPCFGFLIYHAVFGVWWFALSLLPSSASLLTALWLLYSQPQTQRYRRYDNWLLLFSIPPVLLSLLQPSMHGIYLVFPMIVALFFVLPLQTSRWMGALFTLSALFISYQHLTEAAWLRGSISIVMVHLFVWITAMIQTSQHQKLKNMAFLDPLTGAKNRRTLYQELEGAIKLFRRHQQNAVLVMFDLDHFKRLNDSYGHDTGDKILRWFAEQVQARTRSTDHLFRYGGEEFLLLLPHVDIYQAEKLCQALQQQMTEGTSDHHLAVTFSAGCASVSAEDDPDNWIVRADKALYAAKTAGRNTIRLADTPPLKPACNQAVGS